MPSIAILVAIFLSAASEANFSKQPQPNVLSNCDKDVQAEIIKARRHWGYFDFTCQNGLVFSIVSDEPAFSKRAWLGAIKQHLGLFGISKDEFAYFPDQGRYYQHWNGIPINHRSFVWFPIKSEGRFSVYARTVRPASVKRNAKAGHLISKASAEKRARKAAQVQYKKDLKVEKSVLMLSDNSLMTCRKDGFQFVWIVVGENSNGHLECSVAESNSCPVQCAGDQRFAILD